MKFFKKSAVCSGVAMSFLMSGCTTMAINKSEEVSKKRETEVLQKYDQAKQFTKTSTSAVVLNEMFISGNPFKITDKDYLPSFFNDKVVFSQPTPVSFQEIVGNVSSDINSRIELTSDAITYLNSLYSGAAEKLDGQDSTDITAEEDLDYAGAGLVGSTQKFSLRYDGTVSGLLDLVTTKTNLFWKWDKNKVTIYRQETENFIFDGDGTNYDFAASMSTQRSSSGGDSEGAVVGSNQSVSVSNQSGSQFDDIEGAIESMISKEEGRFSISKQQGIITVTDTPDVLRKVGEYVAEMNSIVNKRIAVKTEVYEISVEDTGDFGIDINALYNSSLRVADGVASAVDITGGFSNGGLDFGFIKNDSKFNGSSAVIDALAKVSNVSLVTSSTNYTTNGKTVPVQIAKEKSILAKLTPAYDEEGSVVGFETEIEKILSGLTMTLTPKITSNGDVDLSFSADLSSLDQIIEYDLGDSGTIQLPERSFKNFIQRASVDSGSTLMIAGFDRVEESAETSSMFGKDLWFFGGSKSGGKTRIMTMIMVTPYIISK